LGEDGFESGAATEVDAGLSGFGQGNIEPNGGRFLLSGEVGFSPLFGEWRKLGPFRADEVESSGATDFIESLAEKLFFAVDRLFLEEGKKFAFLSPACADFW
jgi:hypothetical protein